LRRAKRINRKEVVERNNPENGSWNIRFEGLNKAP